MTAERGDRRREPSASPGDGPVSPLGLRAEPFRLWCEEFLRELGEPPYRARQLRGWIFRRTPESFADMSDLPLSVREHLEESAVLHPLRERARQESRDGTRKYLWGLARGDAVESVAIPDADRLTFCISTQSGCPVKCTFCATGDGGFRGQLSAAEITDQVLSMRARSERAPTNLVFMGMGEPLLNFEALSSAIEILTHPDLVGLGARRLTVSTVGVPDRIRELSRRFPQVTIAFSLHAARDGLRDELVPLNRRYPIGDVLEALREATTTTGRRATIEYVVLRGVNDSPRDALDVAHRLEGLRSQINLIGFNPFPGSRYRKPRVRDLLAFRGALAARFPGPITIRRSRGEDIDGACGQLRAASPRARGGGETGGTGGPEPLGEPGASERGGAH